MDSHIPAKLTAFYNVVNWKGETVSKSTTLDIKILNFIPDQLEYSSIEEYFMMQDMAGHEVPPDISLNILDNLSLVTEDDRVKLADAELDRRFDIGNTRYYNTVTISFCDKYEIDLVRNGRSVQKEYMKWRKVDGRKRDRKDN
jgi:hypothetical protein